MKRALSFLLFATACGSPQGTPIEVQKPEPTITAPDEPVSTVTPELKDGVDLPLGSVMEEQKTGDGSWGDALNCKPVPVVTPLVSPKITLSINGLTLHLVDTATGYDRVFPVGPGEIDDDETSPTYGESLSYAPLLSGKQDFQITPSSIQTCKTWWTDPDTGAKSPVFAGLPFMSWNGAYAIHGPIDNYRASNGGNLRRGFVSHGCFRMEAADVLEVYGRIKAAAKTPVHVQREPERLSNGRRVDIPQKWVGAECQADSDCNFTGGYCSHNAYSDRGYCSARCTKYCNDAAGQPTTTCVPDPSNASLGQCVPMAIAQDEGCRNYDHFVTKTEKRFNNTTSATVCVPGSPGWVGDRCLAATDCTNGTSCDDGICTEACTKYCADEPGYASTFCASDTKLGNTCLRSCTLASNASECPADSTCVSRHRPNDTTKSETVCVPN